MAAITTTNVPSSVKDIDERKQLRVPGKQMTHAHSIGKHATEAVMIGKTSIGNSSVRWLYSTSLSRVFPG